MKAMRRYGFVGRCVFAASPLAMLIAITTPAQSRSSLPPVTRRAHTLPALPQLPERASAGPQLHPYLSATRVSPEPEDIIVCFGPPWIGFVAAPLVNEGEPQLLRGVFEPGLAGYGS